jgi:O-antigen/teichoic acid export membrane protein
LWTIFVSVTFFVNLFDFGFSASFSRNISYIFSGVSELQAEGVSGSAEQGTINYSLLKGAIESMRWFYLRISSIVLLLLSTAGTFYISIILKNYSGSREQAYIAWALLCIINAYNLYTFYYDSILVGRGMIRTSKKIIILGQAAFMVLASVLIIAGYGIIAIVSSQLVYVVIVRALSRRAFYSGEVIANLQKVVTYEKVKVLKAVYPNAVKLGFTVLGGILIQRSAIFIGSLYLPLSDIASYGITRQIFDILSSLAPVFVSTYIPLISQYRVEGNSAGIKNICLRGTLISTVAFIAGGLAIYLFGSKALLMIGSETSLLPGSLMLLLLVVSFLEMNHSTAGSLLLTKNEVPFFIPSIVSGLATAILMILLLKYSTLGLWSLIIAPGIVDVAYQSWKWPLEVIRDLKIKLSDIRLSVMLKRITFNQD